MNEKKSFLHSLIKAYTLLISDKSAAYTIKWSFTIIWQVRIMGMKKRPNNIQTII